MDVFARGCWRGRRFLRLTILIVMIAWARVSEAEAQWRPLREVAIAGDFESDFFGLAALGGGRVALARVGPSFEGTHAVRGLVFDRYLFLRHDFLVATRGKDTSVAFLCPVVAHLGGGSLAFAWLETSSETARARIAYRVVGAEGSPLGPIRFVESDRVGGLGCPSLDGGPLGFVVGWSRALTSDNNVHDLRLRTFSVDGRPTSASFSVARSRSSTSVPSIAVEPDGGFVAAWGVELADGTQDLFLGRFGRMGGPLGPVKKVVAGARDLIAFARSRRGELDLIWARGQGSSGRVLRARRFDGDFEAISRAKTVLSTFLPVVPASVIDRLGRTAFIAQTSFSVRGFTLGPTLALCGPEITVSELWPQGLFRIVSSKPGEVVVAGVDFSSGARDMYLRSYALPLCAETL